MVQWVGVETIKRINIFTGHYGSGKTEIAVNFAIYMQKTGDKVKIIDLDIVNPYFRTKDAGRQLADLGIELVVSEFANTNIDLPSLPSGISSAFDQKDRMVVFDVGGDDDGAMALGRYFGNFAKEDYDMYFVINTKRPFSDNVLDIVELAKNIEYTSRLKLTGIINNTNLQAQTQVKDLLESFKVVEEVSRVLGIPIVYVSGTKEIIEKLPDYIKNKGFELELFLKMPW